MKMANPYSRRDFVALSVAGPLVGWMPWFRPKEIALEMARFQIVRHGRSTRRYVLLDGNDDAARQLLTDHMESQRGTAYLIESRTVDVEIAGGKLDPNRMFSRAGAEANLRSLNPGWSADQVAAGLDLLDRQREKLLDALLPPDRGLLIALGGVGSDSATQSAALGDQRSLPQPGHPQQFYLCTDAADYQALAASPYNVVLLQHVRARDDGSLARRAAVRGVRYLRIETSPGDAAQRDMLAWAEAHLP